MKIIIKIKTRDKKKLSKKNHGGGVNFRGPIFRGAIFVLGAIFSGAFFPGAFFLKPKK